MLSQVPKSECRGKWDPHHPSSDLATNLEQTSSLLQGENTITPVPGTDKQAHAVLSYKSDTPHIVWICNLHSGAQAKFALILLLLRTTMTPSLNFWSGTYLQPPSPILLHWQ